MQHAAQHCSIIKLQAGWQVVQAALSPTSSVLPGSLTTPPGVTAALAPGISTGLPQAAGEATRLGYAIATQLSPPTFGSALACGYIKWFTMSASTLGNAGVLGHGIREILQKVPLSSAACRVHSTAETALAC